MIRTRCRGPLFLLLLSLLSACIARNPGTEGVVPINDRPPPIWLRIVPDDAGYFHGIGMVPQSNDPVADQSLAAGRARESMVVEILASLKRTYLNEVPDPTLFDRLAWDGLLLELEQLPPQDVYLEAHKRRLWVYVRVGRAELQQILDRRRVQLEPKARKSLGQADALWQSGNLVEALREQLAALHRVAGPEGLQMKGNASPLLRLEIEQGLSRMLSKVTLMRFSGPSGGYPSTLTETPLVVQATRSDDNTPIRAFPVAFRFSKGEGSVTPTGLTDASGQFSGVIQSVDPRVSPAEVLATPDLQALLAASKLTTLPETAFEKLSMPGARFHFTLNPPRMLLTHIERGGTGGNRSSLVINELAEAFRGQGMLVRDASVGFLVNPEAFRRVEGGKDPGDVPETDYVGVVSISLDKVKAQKGRYQTILTGEGVALFRLYDLSRRLLVMDVRMEQAVSGFSQGDIERNFFLQSMDELRARVIDQLAEDPFHLRAKP